MESTRDSMVTDRRMKRLAASVMLVLVLVFAVVYALRFASKRTLASETTARASATPVVRTVEIRPASGAQSLTLPGETHAWYESTIYARVNGYVAKWNVDIGDRVKKGQVLAEIETPELDAQLAAAQAQLQAAEADVKVREAEAEFARTTNLRWRDAAPGVVSQQERENKKAGYDSAVAQLAASRARVALDRAEISRTAALEKFKHVAAPFDGTIIERSIDIGNLVSAGSSGGTTSLYRLAQDDPMRVWVDVPQAVADDLMKVGVSAEVVTNENPSRRFKGEIARTTGAVEPQTRTFKVEIDVPNRDRTLVSGMYVEVAFLLPVHGLLQVPAAALVFRASGPQVAIVDADGRVHLHGVAIARDDGINVMLASGVGPGDKVILNLSSQITEGQQVLSRSDTDTAPNARTALTPRL